MSREDRIRALEQDWATNPRWKGITRPYTAQQVVDLQGSNPVQYSLAQRGADKL